MKANATLEDFEKREAFLIEYLKKQITKLTFSNRLYPSEQNYGRIKAYKDILFKLEKDGTKPI